MSSNEGHTHLLGTVKCTWCCERRDGEDEIRGSRKVLRECQLLLLSLSLKTVCSFKKWRAGPG